MIIISTKIQMIKELLSMEVKTADTLKSKIKSPGLVNSHYAPNAKVYRSGTPDVGDGFIALASVPTPKGAIRLASPKNHLEFAQVLYSSLRLADIKSLKSIYVIAPLGEGIVVGINDRISKAANTSC